MNKYIRIFTSCVFVLYSQQKNLEPATLRGCTYLPFVSCKMDVDSRLIYRTYPVKRIPGN